MKTFDEWWENDSPFKGVVDKGMAGCIWNAATENARPELVGEMVKVLRQIQSEIPQNPRLSLVWNIKQKVDALLKEIES